MRHLTLTLLLLLTVALPASAQTPDEDRGYLQGLIEDNLSGAGRDVRITGFAGALSSNATIEELTVADDEGIWITLRGLTLTWSRAALLRGRLQVDELSADEVLLPRLPIPQPGELPDPEATPFSLPELPVSVQIDRFAIARVEIGAPVMGTAATISAEGSASLAGGEGTASLAVERLDGATGSLVFNGGFTNETRVLALDLSLTEGPGGIAATLLNLPENPAIELTAAGEGPLDDFTADIALATDGTDRLTGAVSLAALPSDSAPGRGFDVRLSGDIRPLMQPEHRAFFGPDLSLTVAGQQFEDGRLTLETLDFATDALTLNGGLSLGADKWPERIDLSGRIATQDGTPVLLALPGTDTSVSTVDLSVAYDAARGDAWTAAFVIDQLARDDIALDTARISGTGTLDRGTGTTLGRVLGVFDIAATGLAPADPDLAAALGAALDGLIAFDWQQGQPFDVTNLALDGEGYALNGTLSVGGLENDPSPDITADLQIAASDISRFSGLAGRDLGGSIDLRVTGTTAPLDGTFDAKVSGTTRDIVTGIPEADGLLGGTSTLALDAARSQSGMVLRSLELAAPGITASASGTLASAASQAVFDIALPEIARVLPDLEGAARLTGTATQAGDDWTVEAIASGPGGATVDAQAVIAFAEGTLGRIRAQGQVEVDSLAAYAGIAKRPLGGAVALSGSGSFDPSDMTFAANVTGSGTDLRSGIAAVDQLTAGRSTIKLNARREADTTMVVDALDLATPQITAVADGQLGPDGGTLRYDVRLRDLGLFAPGFSGPATARGTASSGGGDYTVNADLTGPGGTNGALSGTLAPDASRANLGLTGSAPLALANSFTAPNILSGLARFDLRLNGAPSLNAVSGSITTSGAELTLPGPRISLTGIEANIGLASGSAQIDLRSGVSSGGNLRVTGPVTLSPPFNGDLAIALRSVGIQDPGLIETQVNGDLTLRGALTRDAQLAGTLNFEAMEIRIPDTGVGASGSTFALTHVGEPAAVRQTRERAGLLASQNERSGPGIAYPLDLTINAPSRIFVRGRGLDAELGGQLRLRGTTANVIPQGEFNLIRGRLDILGQRLALNQASISLQGNFDPFLRVVADTARADVSIRFLIEGLVSAPEVTISSSPERPEEEVLALLLFGRDATQISAFQALRIAAAVNTLVGRGGGGIVDRLRMGFGLDDIDVQTGADGGTELRVGKYLTENIYTDVTVGASGQTEINLNLQVTPQITARGTAGTDGNTGLGVFFEKDY